MRASQRLRQCRGCGRRRRCPYGGFCDTCGRHRLGVKPSYRGPCLCGCPRPGASRSGYARPCYERMWRRAKRFPGFAQTPLAISAVAMALRALPIPTPLAREAVRAALAIIEGYRLGHLSIRRNPMHGKLPPHALRLNPGRRRRADEALTIGVAS